MTFDPMTNRIPWGMLTDDEKTVLKGCGGPWVVFNQLEGWHPCNPYWDSYAVYRQAIPAIIPASVNWSCFGPDIVAVAADYDGDVYAYVGNPHILRYAWGVDGEGCYPISLFSPHAYVRGTDIWQNSLVVLP
jgi:hypothetical protein